MIWAAVVSVIYVVSIGPMSVWTVLHPPSEIEWAVMDGFYRPEVWACRKLGMRETLRHYEQWWEDTAQVPPYPGRRRPGEGAPRVY